MDNSLKAVEINAHTLSRIMKLSVTEAQRKNVAPNSVTIAQNAYEPAGRARGLWHRAPRQADCDDHRPSGQRLWPSGVANRLCQSA